MGLLEGVKKKYYLYSEDGEKAFTIIPLNKDVNNVGNLSGMRYRKIKHNMTDAELLKFKKDNNLKYEHELGDQLDIFKYMGG